MLVTGPTGSGKSTTLASLIDIINRTRAVHIMTVEDPIEFLHQHKKCGRQPARGGGGHPLVRDALKHVLRQDPDVILVGEMRDLETISTALTAAETGHLVFATLHTQDAPQSIDRIIDVFPPTSSSRSASSWPARCRASSPSSSCRPGTGTGRVVAAEVLVATPAVRNLIREGKTHQIYSSMQAGGQYGMQTMDQSLAELVGRARSPRVGIERCHHVEDFNRLAGRG